MAKSVGLIGTVIGKLGNAVGYRIKDSNNKMSQGFRVYQPNVSNPRTYGQALQRARMKPINTFYRALKSIIDRGFEGKSYGNQCRLEFLRLAMANFNGPYVPKGFNGLIPGPFTIANGSLPQVSMQNAAGTWVTTIKVSGAGDIETVGQLSAALLSSNPWMQEGDQITAVIIGNVSASDPATVIVESMVIDSESTDALGFFVKTSSQAGSFLGFSYNGTYLGSACIISREGDSGQHLRSKAVMAMGNAIVNAYCSDDAQAAAVASYMNADGTTDWPEQFIPATDVAQLVTIDVTSDMSGVEVPAGTQCLGFVSKTGEKGVFYSLNGSTRQLLDAKGAVLKYQTSPVTIKADYAGLTTEWSSLYGTL